MKLSLPVLSMIILFAMLVAPAGAPVFGADAAPNGASTVAERKRISEKKLAAHKKSLAEAEAVLDKAESARQLAIKYGDKEALPIAEQAVATATRAVELARERVDEDATDVKILTEDLKILDGINALAKRLNWSVEELERLNKALNALRPDGDLTATDGQIRTAWQDILSRGQGEDFSLNLPALTALVLLAQARRQVTPIAPYSLWQTRPACLTGL